MTPSASDVEAFRAAIARAIGMRFDDDKLPFLAEQLATRMRHTAFATPDGYLSHLSATGDELAELGRTLSVSETYFLRNRDQFRALEAILQQREATPSRHLRVLCAGCSSGEEAYSVAITLRETLANPAEWHVSILGIDLNPDSIDKACAGAYQPWALRETPDDIRERYFHRTGNRYAIVDDVKAMVRFEWHNLMRTGPGIWRSEAYDVVFCRNVLMYFTPSSAREVIANVHRSLSPGGYLFLGHAENLRGLSQDFHLRHSHETFYYQHRAAHEDAVLPPLVERERREAPIVEPAGDSWFEIIRQASGRIETLSRGTDNGEARRGAETPQAQAPAEARADLSPAIDLIRQERYQDALRLLASARVADPDALLLRAVLFVSTGEPAEAEQRCSELLAVDELNASAHYIMAICREHAGDRAGAVEHGHAAAYLDGDFAMPHLQLGRLARRAGDLAKARRELELALGLLPKEDASRIVLFGGGFSREALMHVCRGELAACEVTR